MVELRTEPPLDGEAAAQLVALNEQIRGLGADPVSAAVVLPGLLTDAVAVAGRAGAERVQFDVIPAGPELDVVASMGGFDCTRVLLQLRRSLPLPPPWQPFTEIDVRPFRPGTADEEAWLEVNNRAFDWHPDQSGWTLDDLHARMAEPWFDPQGFLLHERDGRLAGFCWTKVHDEEEPPAGEIFVIGVDPDFQGLGLGQSLTYAGFGWLTDRGLTHALLYAEADNHAAVRLYNRIGFQVSTTHRWYEHRFTR